MMEEARREVKKELKLEMLETGIVNRTVTRMAEEKSKTIDMKNTRLLKKERMNILLVAALFLAAAALTIWAFVLTQPVELEVFQGMPEPKTEAMNNLQTVGEILIMISVSLQIAAACRIPVIRRHKARRLAWKTRAEQRLQAETDMLLARQRGAIRAATDFTGKNTDPLSDTDTEGGREE